MAGRRLPFIVDERTLHGRKARASYGLWWRPLLPLDSWSMPQPDILPSPANAVPDRREEVHDWRRGLAASLSCSRRAEAALVLRLPSLPANE